MDSSPLDSTPDAIAPDVIASDVIASDPPEAADGFIKKHWNGGYSPGRSFFLHYLTLSWCEVALAAVLFPFAMFWPSRYWAAGALLFTVITCGLWIWGLRGTWMSATRHKRAGGSFAGLVKVFVVIAAAWNLLAVVQARSATAEHWRVLLGERGAGFSVRSSPDGTTVAFSGDITDGAADALQQTLDRTPGVTTVSLHSNGGWANDANLLAAVISSRKLGTYVDGACRSACTLAFLAGRVRALGPNGRLAFHQVSRLNSRLMGDLASYISREKTRHIFAQTGLSRDFVDKIAATPPDELWYPTTRELLDAHVITSTAEWDAARAELRPQVYAQLSEQLRDIRMPQQAFDDIVECETSAFIAWLNTTGCPYRYATKKMTREEHAREQDQCITSAGGAAKSAELALVCSKAHIPND